MSVFRVNDPVLQSKLSKPEFVEAHQEWLEHPVTRVMLGVLDDIAPAGNTALEPHAMHMRLGQMTHAQDVMRVLTSPSEYLFYRPAAELARQLRSTYGVPDEPASPAKEIR